MCTMAENSASSPLIVNRKSRSNLNGDQEQAEEIDWWATCLRIESVTFLVARKFKARNGDRDGRQRCHNYGIRLYMPVTCTDYNGC